MSLLLDALKKAEKDKLKAREAEAASATSPAQTPEQQEAPAELLNEPEQALQLEDINEGLELVLDEPDDALDVAEPPAVEESELKVKEPPLTPPIELEKSAATTSTVSDEALQLLVYKTNKRYRRNQKIAWGGLLSVAMIILVTAGTYYYFSMLEEVDALERKHQLAMRAVRAEPVKRHQILELSEASQASETTQQEVISKELAQPVTENVVNTVQPSINQAKTVQNISVKRSDTEDPVNTLLRDAWLAYNRADYSVASSTYEKVLRREPKNRDALLGMAAIAIKNADYEKAKASYQLLLKLNPRDELAMSAMTNINKLSSSALGESKLKFMLQQQPSATHLNFALGNYYARQSRWPEAQSEYFKAWQGNSRNPDYVYNLAVSLDQLGKSEQALRFYKDSLSLAVNQNISFSKDIVEKRIQKISVK